MDKRVMFIAPSLRKGGAETQLLKIASFLKSREYKVLIVSLKPSNSFDIDFTSEGIETFFLKNWSTNFLSNCKAIYDILKDYKPQVVIAFMFIAIIFARIFKVIFRFSLISSIRTPVISKKWYLAFKLTSKLDDIIVYNSYKSKFNFEQKKLIRKGGVVINNAITLPQGVGGLPKKVGQKFVWICVAHFVADKDYKTLFDAIAILKDKNLRLDILGNLYDQDWPFRTIKTLGIEDKVRIMGFKKEARPYLLEADAFVLSSFLEGMPNAMLEAMSCCKPIVGSSVDGIEELLKDVKCGYLFQQGNAIDLADKMIKIMEMSNDERYSLGLAGKRHVESNFSEKIVMEDWQAIVSPLFSSDSRAYSIS